ncbi:hypothetical protein KQX54_017589 [Cotesia glomerata]|uniref:Uncharacterized protein n=1 Tax=Cotesia glomerata TaxID=32391 RepID=A0AAV7HYR1_COTGL|nr:hypothetical protein KQX54_017589 [Cotesia glomerata]
MTTIVSGLDVVPVEITRSILWFFSRFIHFFIFISTVQLLVLYFMCCEQFLETLVKIVEKLEVGSRPTGAHEYIHNPPSAIQNPQSTSRDAFEALKSRSGSIAIGIEVIHRWLIVDSIESLGMVFEQHEKAILS